MSNLFRNPLYQPKFGNRPCVCMNGKKLKKCHGSKYAVTSEELQELKELNDAYNEKVKSLINQIKEHESGKV